MTPFAAPWPLVPSLLAFAASAAVLVVAGSRFARVVDRIADRTGLGEAMAGALLLGATTSLPGLLVTVIAALEGEADLAVSNALGGIAAQTVFLAVADLSYRRANLEHAAASLPNLLQTLILIALLAVVLLAATGPSPGLRLHPATGVLVLVYLFGLRLTRHTRRSPMWWPRHTPETRPDEPDPAARRESLLRLGLVFAALAAVVGLCGLVVAEAGLSIRHHTGLSGSVVGGLFTSVVTSLPELVTALAAVRAGALTLAVGDIVGGNTFDVLFLAAADLAYDGDLYARLGAPTVFLLALTVLLTTVLAAGLVYRERRGIGFEGLALVALYLAGAAVLYGMG
jgi:cation:H+ antiporter